MRIDSLPMDMQIFMAQARKVRELQESQGRAAISLIEGAATPPPSPDGKGRHINIKV